MEINILKEDKNKVELEVINEDHTLCNIIRNELWKQDNVDVSAYNIKHPLISSPVIIVETSKGDPRKTLLKTVEDLKRQVKDIKENFLKA